MELSTLIFMSSIILALVALVLRKINIALALAALGFILGFGVMQDLMMLRGELQEKLATTTTTTTIETITTTDTLGNIVIVTSTKTVTITTTNTADPRWLALRNRELTVSIIEIAYLIIFFTLLILVLSRYILPR